MGDLLLSHNLRERLKEPLGKLITDFKVDQYLQSLAGFKGLITVGDRTTRRCVEAGLKPELEVIDYREKRAAAPPTPSSGATKEVRVDNPAGTITRGAMDAVKSCLGSGERRRLIVSGEEDLLVIPCVLYAREGDVVLYGQPGVGLVSVTVDPQSRTKVTSFLREMGWEG